MDDLSSRESRLDAIVDTAAAIVLSIAALLTTWASYQAALWDGEQAANYSRADQARVRASLLSTEQGQSQAIDLFLFTQWLNAAADADTPLQQFYQDRFRPEFKTAFDAWAARKPLLDPEAPRTPFVMPEYAPALAKQAKAADARADALFNEGQRCNDVSDAYVGATVVLALALFLGGIGQTFDRKRLAAFLTLLAACACAFGFIRMVALPAISL